MLIKLNTANFQSPDAFGFILSYYMYDADNVETLEWKDFPEPVKVYFSYLDSEERKLAKCQICLDTKVCIAEFKGDRYVTDGDKEACAPLFYRDSQWMYTKGIVSMRFELDLEDILFGKDDDEKLIEDGFDDDFD